MHTRGYSFQPWWSENTVADGCSILKYINETYGYINDRTLFYAFIGNHLESIKYILTLGIKATDEILNIENLSKEIKEYLIEILNK